MPVLDGGPDEETSDIMKTVDRLVAANVGVHIELPMLVVVGNQSSGKSSVLEAISKLPFPKDAGLCTRFATHIIFRRHPVTTTKVQINPAPTAGRNHRRACKAWKAEWNGSDPAQKVMGIRSDLDSDHKSSHEGNQTFSEDVLQLEVLGPNEEHFSIVDSPDIFKVATTGKTTKEDIIMVRNMVKRYAMNSRSIILAVVPANVDIATEDVINIAQKHDPHGSRTIGVITKPDLVDKGAERAVIDVLNNRQHQLFHGWYLVRNLGQYETMSNANRDQVETDFFENQIPWNTVPKNKVGTASLIKRLRQLLQSHTKMEFPMVKAELEERLRARQDELSELGPAREWPRQQSKHLMGIVAKFQDIVRLAAKTDYAAHAIFESDDMRLVTKIAERTEEFTYEMKYLGHKYEFDDVPGADEPAEDFEAQDEFETRKYDDLDMIKRVLAGDAVLQPPIQGSVIEWLDKVYTRCRGLETVGDLNLAIPFKEQCNKWEAICQGYISDVIVVVHEFILKLLEHVCPDKTIRQSLEELIMDNLRNEYSSARAEVSKIIHVELNKTPTTQNDKFNELEQKYRINRLMEQIRQKSFEFYESDTRTIVAVQLVDIEECLEKKSNRDYSVQLWHDRLKAYYGIARDRVIDAVTKQGMQNKLLSGDLDGQPGPLGVLNAHLVHDLTDDQLERVAGESELSKARREELRKAIEELEAGKQILRKA